jgi:hypothetical protein
VPISPSSPPQNSELEGLAESSTPELGDLLVDEDLERERVRVSERGTEAIAWYVPFHYQPNEDRWGIYIREIALFGIAEGFRKADPGQAPLQDYVRGLFNAVRSHELFHHRMEVLGLVAEQFSERPLYLAYSRNAYRPSFGTSDCLEEALANATAVRAAKRPMRDHIRAMCDGSPPGYRDYVRFLGKRDYQEGLAGLTGRLRDGSNTPRASVASWFPEIWRSSILDPDKVPMYLVTDPRIPQSLRDKLFPLRIKRVRDVIRYCTNRRIGAKVVHGGKHSKLKFLSGASVPYSKSWVVPPHYFLKQVADVLGLTKSQLIQAIG